MDAPVGMYYAINDTLPSGANHYTFVLCYRESSPHKQNEVSNGWLHFLCCVYSSASRDREVKHSKMKRHILSFLMLIAVSVTPNLVNAIGPVTIGQLTFTLNTTNHTATVKAATGETITGVLNIPSIVHYYDEDYIVTQIATRAFRDQAGITKVNLPNTISVVGTQAFANCIGLSELPSLCNIKTIGGYAFRNDSAICGEIVIPSNVTAIGSYAFYGCHGITKVSYNAVNANTSSPGRIFYNCRNLKTIIVGQEVTNIPNGIFRGCDSLKHVIYSATNATAGSDVFYGCNSLKTVTITANVQSIPDYIFNYHPLDSLSVRATTPPSVGANSFYIGGYTRLIVANSTVMMAYISHPVWTTFIILLSQDQRISTIVLVL